MNRYQEGADETAHEDGQYDVAGCAVDDTAPVHAPCLTMQNEIRHSGAEICLRINIAPDLTIREPANLRSASWGQTLDPRVHALVISGEPIEIVLTRRTGNNAGPHVVDERPDDEDNGVVVAVPEPIPTDGFCRTIATTLDELRARLDSHRNGLQTIRDESSSREPDGYNGQAERPPLTIESRTPVVRLWPGIRWRDIFFRVIDGHTVAIRAGPIRRWLSYHDLGMASEKSRGPVKQWGIFISICENYGTLPWASSKIDAVKRQVSALRQSLQMAFGIEEDPFDPYVAGQGYRARFRVGGRDSER